MTDAVATVGFATPADGAPILAARGVTKVYRTGAETVTALTAVDLDVPRGQLVSVMGPSGSGTVSYTHLTLPTKRIV